LKNKLKTQTSKPKKNYLLPIHAIAISLEYIWIDIVNKLGSFLSNLVQEFLNSKKINKNFNKKKYF
jgi:hypothetical protein